MIRSSPRWSITFSAVSKYRLTPTCSAQLLTFKAALYLLAVLAVWLLKDDVMHSQRYWQTGVTLWLLIVAQWDLRQLARDNANTNIVWLVDDEGRLESLCPTYSLYLLGRHSRVSPFLLWIELCDVVDSGRRQWRWIFRDQLDEQSYRRLSRILLRTRESQGD